MGDSTQPDQEAGAVTKADWIKAFVLIAVIVALIVLFFMFALGVGPFCNCGTKPAS